MRNLNEIFASTDEEIEYLRAVIDYALLSLRRVVGISKRAPKTNDGSFVDTEDLSESEEYAKEFLKNFIDGYNIIKHLKNKGMCLPELEEDFQKLEERFQDVFHLFEPVSELAIGIASRRNIAPLKKDVFLFRTLQKEGNRYGLNCSARMDEKSDYKV